MIDKDTFWTTISELIKKLPDTMTELDDMVRSVTDNPECMRFLLDKTVGVTNDHRMVSAMEHLLMLGGKEILQQDAVFRENLMKKAQIHENQFVVIYEDWMAAEAYLNVYQLLSEA